jgi:hypothetical protein
MAYGALRTIMPIAAGPRSGLARSRSTSRVPLAHGSLVTLRWRKADSNHWSHFRVGRTAASARWRRLPASELHK